MKDTAPCVPTRRWPCVGHDETNSLSGARVYLLGLRRAPMRTYGSDWYMHDVRTINGVDATYKRTYHTSGFHTTQKRGASLHSPQICIHKKGVRTACALPLATVIYTPSYSQFLTYNNNVCIQSRLCMCLCTFIV